MIDLHIHTTASVDGQHSPEEIFKFAKERGVTTLSFCDHNCVDALDRGLDLADDYGMEFIPSVELNTAYDGKDLHLLAYFISIHDERTTALLTQINDLKWDLIQRRVDRLCELGFTISIEDVRKISAEKAPTGSAYFHALLSHQENLADDRISVYLKDNTDPHKAGYQFYRKYIKPTDSPAFVPFEGISTHEAIDRVRELSATPVLAHPGSLPESVIMDLVANGLSGLEVYSSKHDVQTTKRLLELATRQNLILTAGSDFHGSKNKPGVSLGMPCPNEEHLVDVLRENRLPVVFD